MEMVTKLGTNSFRVSW